MNDSSDSGMFMDIVAYRIDPRNFTQGLHITHLPFDKMAAILADNIFNCIFLIENDKIPIQISLKYVPMSPIDNKPALVQVMA